MSNLNISLLWLLLCFSIVCGHTWIKFLISTKLNEVKSKSRGLICIVSNSTAGEMSASSYFDRNSIRFSSHFFSNLKAYVYLNHYDIKNVSFSRHLWSYVWERQQITLTKSFGFIVLNH